MNGRHEHECQHLGHYLEHRKEVLRECWGVCDCSWCGIGCEL